MARVGTYGPTAPAKKYAVDKLDQATTVAVTATSAAAAAVEDEAVAVVQDNGWWPAQHSIGVIGVLWGRIPTLHPT